MSIRFACPVCKTTYTVNEKNAGQKADCKKCGQRLEVPAPLRAKTVLGEVLEHSDDSKTTNSFPPQPPEVSAREQPVRGRKRRYSVREERAPMYGNEESVRFRSDLSGPELERLIEDAASSLGYVQFFRGGEFDISGGRFQSFATDVKMTGYLSRGRRDDEWTVCISYSVAPSTACWVLAILGFLFFLIGLLILIIPFTAKSNVQQAVRRAVREVSDRAERERD